MTTLKLILTLISSGFILYGLFLILWPFPYFLLLPESWRDPIIKWFYNLPKDDPSAGAALPFLWLFWHVPWGILYVIIGFLTKVLKGSI